MLSQFSDSDAAMVFMGQCLVTINSMLGHLIVSTGSVQGQCLANSSFITGCVSVVKLQSKYLISADSVLRHCSVSAKSVLGSF